MPLFHSILKNILLPQVFFKNIQGMTSPNNVMAFENLLVLTFENCSKNYDCFNPLSINQIFKMNILGPPKNQKI
jgi:hypothetical protein